MSNFAQCFPQTNSVLLDERYAPAVIKVPEYSVASKRPRLAVQGIGERDLTKLPSPLGNGF
jgi:hypothetical protein